MLRCLFALTGVVWPVCVFAQTEPLVVFLDSSRSQPPAVIAKFKTEVADVLRPSGISVEFRQLESRKSGESFAQFVVVKWHGSCDGSGNSSRVGDQLAFAHVSEDRVLPFLGINCGAVNALLSSRTQDERARFIGIS